MNEEQEKAIKSLKRALNKCHKASLHGGVYDGHFGVVDAKFTKEDAIAEMCAGDESKGEWISSDMSLDGGAGV